MVLHGAKVVCTEIDLCLVGGEGKRGKRKKVGEKRISWRVTSQSQSKEGQQSKKRSGQKYTLPLFIPHRIHKPHQRHSLLQLFHSSFII